MSEGSIEIEKGPDDSQKALTGLSLESTEKSRNMQRLQVLEKAPHKSRDILQGVSSFYDSSRSPWSSPEASEVCDKIVELQGWSSEDYLWLVESYRQVLGELSKLEPIKRSKFKVSPLIGRSYSDTVDERTAFRNRNIGKLNGLKLVADKLPAKELEHEWGVVLPLTMSFLNDPETLVRVEACYLLQHILKKLPVEVVERTHVEPIIFESIVPCLLALPSMTPTSISAKTLPVAYGTVLQLWTSIKDPQGYNLKLAMLLNDFIVPSVVKVGEIPELVTVLLDVVQHQLIPASKEYLIVLQKQILYMLLDLLNDPYIPYALEVVVQALNIIERQLWSDRLLKCKYDIMGALLALKKRLDRSYSSRENSVATTALLGSIQSQIAKLLALLND